MFYISINCTYKRLTIRIRYWLRFLEVTIFLDATIVIVTKEEEYKLKKETKETKVEGDNEIKRKVKKVIREEAQKGRRGKGKRNIGKKFEKKEVKKGIRGREE